MSTKEFFYFLLLGGSFPSLGNFPHTHTPSTQMETGDNLCRCSEFSFSAFLCYSCPQAPVALVISDFQLHVCNSGRPLVSFCISPFSSASLEIFLSSKLRESVGSLFFSSLREKPDLPDIQNKITCFLYCFVFFFNGSRQKGTSHPC